MIENNDPIQEGYDDAARLVRAMRESAGLSPTQLAKKTGLCRSTIWQAEKGGLTAMQIRTLVRIAKACNCRLRLDFQTLTPPGGAPDNAGDDATEGMERHDT